MSDPMIAKMTHGYGPVGLLLMLLAAGGLLMRYIPGLPTSDMSAEGTAFMLIVLAGTGVVLIFAQVGIVVDRKAGRVTRWRGLPLALFSDAYAIETIMHVHLTKRVVEASKGARVSYPVVLIQKDRREITLWRNASYAGGRREAEELARLLHVKLQDETSGEAVVREAASLNESLAERYRRLGTPVPFREPPSGTTTQLRWEQDALVVEYPATGFSTTHLVVLILMVGAPLLALGVQVYMDVRGDDAEFLSGLVYVLAPLAGAFILAVVLFVIELATATESIRVSRSGIVIETRSRLRHRRQSVPAARIEEIVPCLELRKGAGSEDAAAQALAYSGGARAVLIRTDSGITGAGRWVSEQERLWLRDMLVHGLVADPAAAMPRVATSPPVRAVESGKTGRGKYWLAGTAAAGILLALLFPSDRLPISNQRPEPVTIDSGQRVRIHVGSATARVQGPDVEISLRDLRLEAVNAVSPTQYSEIRVSIWRNASDILEPVGSIATSSEPPGVIQAGSALVLAAPTPSQ